MYTTTIKVDGKETVSRFFTTRRAANKWFKWLTSQKFAEQVKLYRGQAGEELLETYEKVAA